MLLLAEFPTKKMHNKEVLFELEIALCYQGPGVENPDSKRA